MPGIERCPDVDGRHGGSTEAGHDGFVVGPGAHYFDGGQGARDHAAMTSPGAADIPDKDLPLRDDIRRLGRVLGDIVREQEGEAVFALVERIRQT